MTAQISSISDRFGHRVQLSEPMSHLEVHEIPTDESSTAGPIAVYTSFVVSPDDANPWVETWTALAAVAGTWPGCRIFRILRDRNDPMFMAAISEWDCLDAYTTFVHRTQSIARRQTAGHVCVPCEARFMDVVPLLSDLETAG